MNTRELTRREELCRSLNMDFDEAAELFSDETLESMQMAKVNGGWWPSLLPELIVAGVTWLLSGTSSTPGGGGDMTEKEKASATKAIMDDIIETISKDPLATKISMDSLVGGKVYGFTYERSTTLPPPPTKVN